MKNKWEKYKIEGQDVGNKWEKYSHSEPMQTPQELEGIAQQPVPPQPAPPPETPWYDSPLIDAATGIEKSMGDLTHGIWQPFAEMGLFGERWKKKSRIAAQDRLNQYLEAQKASPIATTVGSVAGSILPSIPLVFAGGPGAAAGQVSNAGRALKTLKGLTKTGLTSGAFGAMEYQYPGESRAQKALDYGLTGIGIHAGLGSAIGAAKHAASALKKPIGKLISAGKKLMGNKKEVSKDVFERLLDEEVNQTLGAQKSAERLGINLTPAEASSNPLLGGYEGDLGVNLRNAKKLYQYKKGQKEAQKKSVEKFLEEISPGDKIASEDIRGIAKKIINDRKKSLQKKAEPFYRKAEKTTIPESTFNNLMKDSIIEDAYKKVRKDPVYKTHLEGLPPNSIKVLDQVKKHMNGLENNYHGKGYTNEAGLVFLARNKLTKALDKTSKDYKKARGIYSEDMPEIKKIENSRIGKIANIKDDNLKNVSKMIFDPQETDIKNFIKIRNQFQAESPDAWKNIVKNEISRRLGSIKDLSSNKNYGSNFYNAILSKDSEFKRFYAALGNKKLLRETDEQIKLHDMRNAFKGLINSRTVKTAAGQSETGMNKPRSGAQYYKKLFDKMFKGKYDDAAIEIITDKDWTKYLSPELKKQVKNRIPRNKNKLLNILSEVDEGLKANKESIKENIPVTLTNIKNNSNEDRD